MVQARLDHHGEELERLRYCRLVSCRVMTGRNSLVTECIGINRLADCWQTG